ncbi:hypothetical protein CPTC_00978 [Corynebacterium pseudotuberculosis]|nr:hypothetical protein CPTC_00978 [Corynebacterium pseudotuberculosis]
MRTIRARMAYTLTVASESKADTFVTLSVPHKRSKQVVISEFSKEDNKLVREGVLDAEGVYPVGADLHDGNPVRPVKGAQQPVAHRYEGLQRQGDS